MPVYIYVLGRLHVHIYACIHVYMTHTCIYVCTRYIAYHFYVLCVFCRMRRNIHSVYTYVYMYTQHMSVYMYVLGISRVCHVTRLSRDMSVTWHTRLLCIICVMLNLTQYTQYMYTCMHARMYVLGILHVYIYACIHVYITHTRIHVCTMYIAGSCYVLCVFCQMRRNIRSVYTYVYTHTWHILIYMYALGTSRVISRYCVCYGKWEAISQYVYTCIHIKMTHAHI